MLFGEILEFVVVEVAAESDGGQDEDRPVVHPRPAAIRIGVRIDILGNRAEQFVAERGLTVDMLQCREDGDDLITAGGVEADVEHGSAAEAKLRLEGDAHR